MSKLHKVLRALNVGYLWSGAALRVGSSFHTSSEKPFERLPSEVDSELNEINYADDFSRRKKAFHFCALAKKF